MSKKNKIMGLLLMITLLVVGTFLYLNRDSLKSEDATFKRVDYVSKNDTPIKDDFKLEGKHLRYGGPFKSGDTVLGYGMATKVKFLGIKNSLVSEEKSPIKYAAFKVDYYNLSSGVANLKLDDFQLHYAKESKIPYNQPITADSYANWKYIDGSFSLSELTANTERSGFIFYPVNDSIEKGGFLRVMLQGVPVDFNF